MDEQEIFKNGSTTYYWSSKFFSEAVRADVYKLYSFVRVADDFVDARPSDKKSFDKLVRLWRKRASGKPIRQTKGDIIALVVQNMYGLVVKYELEPVWVDAFIESMKMDMRGRSYHTMADTLEYIYGSAEVIGLMMAKILGVKEDAYQYARLQGRAMQYINFIRDINEDIQLKRCYFPASELAKYGLPKLTQKNALKYPAAYREFIEAQLAYYYGWQQEASKGFKAVPYSQRIALRTAVDMYNWTAEQLAQNPYVVFDKKVKPSKYRVVARAMRRMIHA